MRALRWLFIGLIGLALALGVAVWVADTSIGHRFVADRIAALSPRSGLKVRVGRIEGSLFGETRITGLRLADPRGVFFEAPAVTLDWQPFDYLANRLTIDRLIAPTATLHRLPRLNPGDPNAPILPSFDIRVGELRIDRLMIGEGVTRPPRVARLTGRADIRDGRALVHAGLRASAGDRLAIRLDAAPDRDIFDVAATIDAPAGGAVAGVLGLKRALALRLDGDGSWTEWRGGLIAQLAGQPFARLTLTARRGRYDLDGFVRPTQVTKGRLAALTGPRMRVIGNARLDRRRLDTRLALASPALALSANGVVDLASSSFDAMRIDARLLRPGVAVRDMTGRDIALKLLLDGPFATAAFDYALTAPRVVFGTTGIDDLRAVGRGRLSKSPVLVPVRLTARRVTGVGEVAGGILSNLSITGVLRATSKLVTGDGLKLASDKLNGQLTLLLDLATGRYDIGLTGGLNRYLIPGLGIVDVKSVLNVVPGAGGKGIRVVGRGQAWVRRFDNAFLRNLAGGLPYIDTALERTPDGIIRFYDLKLRAPQLTLAGTGYRRRDGSFYFEGSGRQARYGPVQLRLDGRIERPKIDLLLASPQPAAGLRDVTAQLLPTAAGFGWSARGQSVLGSFSGNGAILLPRGGESIVRIAALTASGINATGDLRVVEGGLAGPLGIAGGGLTGDVVLGIERGFQRVAARLTARDVKIVGPPLTVVQRGRLDLVAVLDPAGTTVDATFQGQGLRRGDLTLARLAANARLVGGVGEVRATLAGSRGRGFELRTVAQVAPSRIVLTAQGTVDKRPIRLTAPAMLTRDGAGWRLAPAAVVFDGGRATVGGRFGGGATELDATVAGMPLSVLDIISPDLGLGGSASGRVAFRLPDSGAPSGSATLRVRNLTRSGVTLVSTPVDAGVNLLLDGNGLVMRAVAASGGQTIGRAQARIAPLSGGGALTQQLARAPLFAQVRYSGPADAAWRLTGIESFDLSGPVAIGADVGGTLNDPRITGSVRSDNLRLESAASGTVITGLKAAGRFDASRLLIDRFTGTAGRGTVSGRASFDLAAASGFGIDIAVDAQNAALIARDDFSATVTGPLRIASNGGQGRITGKVVLDRGAFRLGRASAVQAIPTLRVREINRPFGGTRPRAAPMTWALDIAAVGDDRLAVTGLGLDSEWSADLQLQGSLDAPRILGRAEVVRGGYEFAGKRFELRRGTIRFQGSYPPDPVVDIIADANIQSISATISVTGTAQRPEIAFQSTPALPQDELLSRLLFGTSITNLSAPEALQLASAVGSLSGGGGLDPINAVRRAIGLDRLRFVAADATIGNKTAVAVGKYVTRRTYVELVTDGQGYSATRVEFAITRWLSLLSTISTVGRQSASVRVSRDY